ncbi:MAG: amidohydrolase family protein [Lachnospiraceae bacterium]|nr:amidohydrolase family protein [Lachnospiraceae bacterium]
MKSIDVFCHLMPKKYAELAMKESPNRSHMFVRALKTQAMSDMDYRAEVLKQFPGYKQIPNIVSPPVEAFVGPDKSPKIAAIGNDEIKEITEKYPEYYEGFIAGIPFNNVPASVDEIKRCKAMGAKGVQIYTNMNGEAIDQEKFWPIYEICEKLELPILIHPVGGQMTPEYPTEERSKYELWFLIGWPYQTTVAMCRLAFAGIFEDFPNLKIVTHHVGAMIPMLEGRIGNGLKMYGGRTAPELKEALTKTKMKGDPLDTFKKFYADTASFGSTSAIRAGIDFFGKDHILFASDMPFDPEKGPGYIDRTLKCIDQLQLSEEDQAAILYGNAQRLFHV